MSELKGVIYGGQKLEVCDSKSREMLADAFSAEKEYVSGDYCIYDNTLYRFTKSKDAGEWDPAAVKATTVQNELAERLEKDTVIDDRQTALLVNEPGVPVGCQAFTALNNDLGKCSFSVKEDGAYVTYIPLGGADAVSKKLGSGKVIFSIHYMGYTGTAIDVRELEKITINVTEFDSQNTLILVRSVESLDADPFTNNNDYGQSIQTITTVNTDVSIDVSKYSYITLRSYNPTLSINKYYNTRASAVVTLE